MQHIKNFIRTIKRKAIEYGIVAAVVVTITAYAYQPFTSTYHKISEALSHTTEYAIASSTPSDKEQRIEELKQSKEGDRILSIWAEKTWIAEQEAALEATKEKLRGEELDFLVRPEAKIIDAAIVQMEAAGRKNCHKLKGASGEIGCRQMLPATWRARALETLGYVPERTPLNEEYVNVAWIENRLDLGYSPKEIGLLQNQGSTGPCRKGINKYGVAYDSCSYAQKFVALLNH